MSEEKDADQKAALATDATNVGISTGPFQAPVPNQALAPTSAQVNVQLVAPVLDRYIAQHTIRHDGREYPPGAVFQSADEALLADLKRQRAIKLEVEVLAAEELLAREAQQAQQAQALADANAQIEALKAQLAEANAGAKRPK